MPAPPIPTWKERLAACFRFRHRLLHVFGVPGAIGAIASVAAANVLNPDTGMALGALVAGMGSLIAGYYVTAGFDRRLVERLQSEKLEDGARLSAQHVQNVVWNSPPEIRPVLEHIVATHASIETVFADGPEDAVELYRRLGDVIQQSDGRRLFDEMNRLKAALAHAHQGPSRKAQEEAHASAERTYGQWYAAVEKQRQIGSVLTVIDKNLEEFRLAMALRKVDALEGEESAGNVSELQARLTAAGEACDELVGRTHAPARRAGRARA